MRLDNVVGEQIVVALVIAPLFLFGFIALFKWKDVGLQAPQSAQSLFILWLPALYILLFLSLAASRGFPDDQVVVFILLNTLLVGVSEELMFRGVFFKGAYSRFSLWKAVWITSIVFGGMHVLNVIITGDFVSALWQALQVTVIGVWFMAVRLYTGSILPAMFVHWLWDFSVFMAIYGVEEEVVSEVVVSAERFALFLLILPLFVYSLVLIRRVDVRIS